MNDDAKMPEVAWIDAADGGESVAWWNPDTENPEADGLTKYVRADLAEQRVLRAEERVRELEAELRAARATSGHCCRCGYTGPDDGECGEFMTHCGHWSWDKETSERCDTLDSDPSPQEDKPR